MSTDMNNSANQDSYNPFKDQNISKDSENVDVEGLKKNYSKALKYIEAVKDEKDNLRHSLEEILSSETPAFIQTNPSTIMRLSPEKHVHDDYRLIELENENKELANLLKAHMNRITKLQKENEALRNDTQDIEILRKENAEMKGKLAAFNKHILYLEDKSEREKTWEQVQAKRDQKWFENELNSDHNAVKKYAEYICHLVENFDINHFAYACFKERFINFSEIFNLVKIKGHHPALISLLKYLNDVLLNINSRSHLKEDTSVVKFKNAATNKFSVQAQERINAQKQHEAVQDTATQKRINKNSSVANLEKRPATASQNPVKELHNGKGWNSSARVPLDSRKASVVEAKKKPIKREPVKKPYYQDRDDEYEDQNLTLEDVDRQGSERTAEKYHSPAAADRFKDLKNRFKELKEKKGLNQSQREYSAEAYNDSLEDQYNNQRTYRPVKGTQPSTRNTSNEQRFQHNYHIPIGQSQANKGQKNERKKSPGILKHKEYGVRVGGRQGSTDNGPKKVHYNAYASEDEETLRIREELRTIDSQYLSSRDAEDYLRDTLQQVLVVKSPRTYRDLSEAKKYWKDHPNRSGRSPDRSQNYSSVTQDHLGKQYPSFTVAFGQTESRVRPSISPENMESRRVGVLEIQKKKKIEDYPNQTYDVIRGKDLVKKKYFDQIGVMDCIKINGSITNLHVNGSLTNIHSRSEL